MSAAPDEWIDLVKTKRDRSDVPVTVTISSGGRQKKTGPLSLRCHISLRGEFAEWAKKYGPRFNIQITRLGEKAKITPGGQFNTSVMRGVYRFILGAVPQWPKEAREPTAAATSFDGSSLILKLPEAFYRPGTAGELPPSTPPNDPDEELSDKESAVLGALISNMDENKISRISHSAIAMDAEVSGGSVHSLIDRLIQKEFIRSLPPAGPGKCIAYEVLERVGMESEPLE